VSDLIFVLEGIKDMARGEDHRSTAESSGTERAICAFAGALRVFT
jgi:hypothetical protein